MTPYRVFEIYCSLKAHFSQEKYDFIKFKGKLKTINPETFNKRNDKYFFKRLAKNLPEREVVPFFVSNFIKNNSLWIGELEEESADTALTDWKRRVESLSYVFDSEINDIVNFGLQHNLRFQDMFRNDGKRMYPLMFEFLIKEIICIETFIILDDMAGFIKRYNQSNLEYDVIWMDWEIRIRKYRPFMPKYNKEKFEDKVRSIINKYN